VILTPHNGGASPLRLGRCCELLAENIRRFKDGEDLRYVVDTEAGF